MMFKTFEDVKKVAAAGKPDEVLDLFVISYLQGEKLRSEYRQALKTEGGVFPAEEGFQGWLSAKLQDEDFQPVQIDATEIEDFKRENYAVFRAGGYPSLTELADALYHAHVDGDDSALRLYFEKCRVNKQRFAK